MAATDGGTIPTIAAAPADAVANTLWQAAGRCRGLARCRERFVYDALAVAGGVRAVAMVDYARVTPSDLARALAPLSAVPGFKGALLELDGCCYAADLPHLQRRLLHCIATDPPPNADTGSCCSNDTLQASSSADGAGGASAAALATPLLVGFEGSTPSVANSAAALTFREQLRPLLAAVRTAAAAPNASYPAPGGGGAAASAAGAAHPWPVISLGTLPGLPCMPTLNGWLLGYPVVYLVSGYEDAAKASRLLSASVLHRVSLRLGCAALQRIVASGGGAQQGQSTATGSAPRAGGTNSDLLLAFTVPVELHSPSVDENLQALLAEARAAVASGALAHVWAGPPTLSIKSVGPGAVSL